MRKSHPSAENVCGLGLQISYPKMIKDLKSIFFVRESRVVLASSAIAMIFVTGCTTTSLTDRRPVESALITIEQPSGVSDRASISAIDGQRVSEHEPVTRMWVTPGEHEIVIQPSDETLNLQAVAGESYTVRVQQVGASQVYWVEGKRGDVVAGQPAGPSAYKGLDTPDLVARFESAAGDPGLRGDILQNSTNETFSIQAFRMEPDAERRVIAVRNIHDQDFLSSISLLYAEDPIVRVEAINRLDRVDVLAKLAMKSPDDASRLAAKRRLKYLSEKSENEEVRKSAKQAAQKLIAEKRW